MKSPKTIATAIKRTDKGGLVCALGWSVE